MPLYHNSILCVTVPELLKCKISLNTLKDGLKRHRNGDVNCWPHHKDGIVYIHYDGLKECYKELIRGILCGGIDPHEYAQQIQLEEYLELKHKDEQDILSFQFEDGKGLSVQKIAQFQRACKYLNLLDRFDKTSIRKEFHQDIASFYKMISSHSAANNTGLPKSYKQLHSKVRQYHQKGALCLVNRKFGNKNTAKLGKVEGKYSPEMAEKMKAIIQEANDRPQNFNLMQITRAVNKLYKAHGLAQISYGTVFNVLKTGDSKGLHSAGSQGIRDYNNNIAMQVKRKRVFLPMQFVSVDGWDVELYYQITEVDKKGNSHTDYNRRMVLVVVLDPFCDYPLGYAIGDRETAELIREANRNAIQHAHDLFGNWYRPLQIQSDHYAFKQLSPFYEAASKHFTPAAVGNAKSKPIEYYFNRINHEYFQMLPSWSGHNITASKKNQPNKEYLDRIKHQFPTRQECLHTIELVMAAEREKKHNDYIGAWEKVNEQRRSIMTREQFLMICGETSQKNSITGYGIVPTIMGKKMAFDTFDIRFRELSHLRWQVQYDPNDLSTILAISEDNLYKFLLEAKYEQPMALADRIPGDSHQLQMVRDFNKLQQNNLSQKRIKNMRATKELMESIPVGSIDAQTEATLKAMFTIKGQQKELLQDAKKLIPDANNIAKKAKKLQNKQLKEAEKSKDKDWEGIQEEYMATKVNFDKYLD